MDLVILVVVSHGSLAEATLRHRGTRPMFGTRNGRLDACALDALEVPTQTMREPRKGKWLSKCPFLVHYELLNGRITIMMYIYIYDI